MTEQEPTVQVPVSLIEEAPHTPGCQIDGLWILPERGGIAQQWAEAIDRRPDSEVTT